MIKRGIVLAGVAVAVAFVFCAAGCEKTKTGMTLIVDPPEKEINANGAVLLTASLPESEEETRLIYYPLLWSVSDSRIGFMRDMAGDSAVYEGRNLDGINTITVRDQAGAEGLASITQVRIVLEVTPAATNIAPGGTVFLTASSRNQDDEDGRYQIVYPLQWSVSSSSIGFIRDMAGDSAVYEGRNAVGVNTVTVRDQAGAEGIAVVTQE